MQGADAKESELPPESLDRLAHACLVVNALGPAVRDQVMDWLCEKEMGVYATVFGGTSAMPDTAAGPGSRLERFEARFAWFRKRLEEKKDVYALFPDAWRVPQVGQGRELRAGMHAGRGCMRPLCELGPVCM